jgi:hypothetical protein
MMSEPALSRASIEASIVLSRRNCAHPIKMNGGIYYAATVSRHAVAIMVMENAKAKWKEQYRSMRLARRGLAEPMIHGEIGVFEGVKFTG